MASNEARKKAAKLYQQQHPGIPYPEALRIVSRLNDFHPLTAVISAEENGKFVRFNFEEASLGGLGPHCGISGRTGSGKTNLLAVMAESMLQAPPARGVEIVLSTDAPAPLFDSLAHTAVIPADLGGYLQEVLAGRQAQLKERGWMRTSGEGEDPLPAVVVMVDDPHWLGSGGGVPTPATPATATAALRMGRALDVHLVVTWQTPTTHVQLWAPHGLESHLTGRIHLTGKQPGLGTWRRYSNIEDPAGHAKLVSTDISVPLAETFRRGDTTAEAGEE